ncbi:Methyl-accepting chemotaxis protein (MCP) signaling domain protein [anaerobic digester metagenome]
MFNTIQKKLIAGFSLILLILISSTAYNQKIYNDDKMHIMEIKEKAIVSFIYATEIKNNVIQVGQFFTDVSATKNTVHLKEAEEQYNLYKSNSKELSSINPEYKKQLDEINIELDNLYFYGKEMADMYITNGHENGNIMMDEFDKMADNINSKVSDIQKKIESSLNDDLMTLQMHLEMNQKMSIYLAAINVVLSIIIVVLLSRVITKPILNFLNIFKDLENGEGDLTRRIYVKTKDEMLKLAMSFNNFMESLEKMVLNIKINSDIISKGSILLNEGGIQAAQSINLIKNNTNRTAEDTQKINIAINQITDSIFMIAQSSQTFASDAQNINIEIDSINNLTQEGEQKALSAKLEMEKTKEISLNTIDITEKLGSQADEIGKIIDTIKSITVQTHLLALNASIEAARAGQSGKAFGVVADEIRNLAESNNKSAENIENIILNIQNMIKQTTEATSEVGENIEKGSVMVENVHTQLQNIINKVSNINDKVQNIVATAEEQSASTEELSATMEAIKESNMTITASMQEAAASISEQNVTISNLSVIASDLNTSSEQLKGLICKFKLQEE